MKSTKVSYSFGSIDTKVPKVPSSNYESVPHSIDFIPPTPGLGFLRDVGGVVYGKLTYQYDYNLTNPLDLPHKGWVENYVTNLLTDLTTGEGGLSEGVIKGLFSAVPNPILTYNSSTGVFTLDTDLSKYSNTPGFITTETDPVFQASEAKNFVTGDKDKLDEVYGWGDHSIEGYITEDELGEFLTEDDLSNYVEYANWMSTAEALLDIVSKNYSNWNTAVSWGDHEDLYRPINWVPKWSDLTGTPPELDTFLIPGDTKESLITNSEGEFEWYKIKHSDVIAGDNQHLTQEQKDIIVRPATTNQSGYLTAADWDTFNRKLDELQLGNLLAWDNEGLLVVVDEVLPVDDNATDAGHTLSAKKIYELLQGEEEEEEEDTTTMSYGQSFTIFIPGGADLVTKLGFTYKIPSGWTIGVVGGSSGDLEITHSLGKLPASISVFRNNGDGTKSKLEGATAYGDAKSTSTDNKLILTSYANTSLATEIRLIF